MEGLRWARVSPKAFLFSQAVEEPRGTLGDSVHAGDPSAIREQLDSVLIIPPCLLGGRSVLSICSIVPVSRALTFLLLLLSLLWGMFF